MVVITRGRRRRVARLGIRRHGCSHRTAQSTAEDGPFTTADFVADGRAGRTANASAYGGVQGGVARVCRCREKGDRQEEIS
jgi:hypothetical protein